MKAAFLLFALIATQSFAAREFFNDGSYTDFTEGGGERKWIHAVPIGGDQYRVQYVISEQYYNYGGFTFRGESYRMDDTNVDGVADYIEQSYTTSNGGMLISKVEGRDGGGQGYTQYSDSVGRGWSSPGWQGRAGLDPRTVVRIYANGICYVQGNGCEMEVRGDLGIQRMNYLHQFRVVEEARKNRDADPLAVQVAEMRYEREGKILAALKAAGFR